MTCVQLIRLFCLQCTPQKEVLSNLSHCLGQRLCHFDCSADVSTSDVLRQVRGAITCGIWLCYYNLERLNTSVLSFLSSLLTQMQNVAAAVPAWMELHGDCLPQYGIFGLTNGSLESHKLLDPILKRTACITPPSVDVAAKILFPQQSKAVIDFATMYWMKGMNGGGGRDAQSIVETLRQISNVIR